VKVSAWRDSTWWGYKIAIKTRNHEIVLEFEKPRWVGINIDGHEIWCKHPDEFLKAISEGDERKIAFIKKLAESGLRADKHQHFDFGRLEKAVRVRKAYRKIVDEWNELFRARPRKPVIVGEYLFILDYHWLADFEVGTYDFLVKTLTDEPRYFRTKIAPQTFVNIYRGKNRIKLIRKLRAEEIDREDFACQAAWLIKKDALDISGFEEYLPEVVAEAVKMKLESS